MDEGALVPDEVTNGIVEERLQKEDTQAGFMLDGFPRTEAQAKELGGIMTRLDRDIDAVIYLDVPAETLKERLSGRIICRNCGATYHKVLNKPKVDGVCDVCGSHDFYQREDDKPEVVENRLNVNQEQQQPILDFYEGQGKLYRIPGDIGIDNVYAEIQKILDK